ncbi:hypothetical protein L6R52_30705 [Myxococcota bacterium]|nr:hypothetical protein [Myxococcota bacterium]
MALRVDARPVPEIIADAFRHYAPPPHLAGALMPDQLISAFVLANVGLARLGLERPRRDTASSAEERAWDAIGTILHLGERAGLSGEAASPAFVAAWAELGRLVVHAAEPLWLVYRARAHAITPVADPDSVFPRAELLNIARAAIQRRTRLPRTEVGPWGSLVERMAGWIGQFGDEADRPLLSSLRAEGEFARGAVAALQALDSRRRQPTRG